MDNPRLLLWISFGLICFLLWDAWVKDYGPRSEPAAATQGAETPADDSLPVQ